ncbi:MAG: hypothetical protein E6Q33_07570 [Neisseriales bacterium]|nr:MAG: hypothetical protein E6Q33_07570 [Neisseriales bacterium]
MKSKLNNNLKSYLLVTLLSGIIAACNSGGSPAKTSTTQQTSGAKSMIQESGPVESFIAILKKSNISLTLVPNQDSRVSLITMTNYYGYRNDPSNLDGYNISFYIDGTNYYSRTVLVGGQYHVDPTAGIVMDNADQWEIDPTINPLIAPNSSVLNSTFNLTYTIGEQQYNYHLQCPDNDNLQSIENSLVAQGRNELATKISKLTCTGTPGVTGGSDQTGYISINNIPPTRLYIPLQVNYNGYKTFTIWNSTNGVRADHYGDATSNDPNNDHCPYIDTFSFASNDYDGGHIIMPNNGYWQGFCWNYSNQLTIDGWE